MKIMIMILIIIVIIIMMIIIITIMALDFPDLNCPYGHYPK